MPGISTKNPESVKLLDFSDWEEADDSDKDPDFVPDSVSDSYDSDASAVFPLFSSSIPAGCNKTKLTVGLLKGMTSSVSAAHLDVPANHASVCQTVNSDHSSDEAANNSEVVPASKLFVSKGQKVRNPGSGIKLASSLSYVADAVSHENVLEVTDGTQDRDEGFDDEENEASSNQSVAIRRKKKVQRPCKYCGLFQTNLHRHLKLKHDSESDVKHALSLPYHAQCQAFAKLRKEGILKHNKEQMKTTKPVYIKERHQTDDSNVVFCATCNGFVSKYYFKRHQIRCTAELAEQPKALPISLMKESLDGVKLAFKSNILAGFINDETGDICRSDEAIIYFGTKLYDKLAKKADKKQEVQKSVRADMRRIAKLYAEFKRLCTEEQTPNNSSADMLIRSNFDMLADAIEACTTKEDKTLKAGLKTLMYYGIKNFAKITRGSFLIRNQDDKAHEISKFVDVLELNHNIIFGDATYELNKNRQVKLRRPQQLPDENDVARLKTYVVGRLASLLEDPYKVWNGHDYIELRDLTVSRLTLFNARRGGEPARMFISEWKDAENSSWLDKRRVLHNDPDRNFFEDMKVTFQTGKGNNHLVPVLIPQDLVKAMQTLTDTSVRSSSSVQDRNVFIFPSTQNSESHVSGWHAVNRVCIDAKVLRPDLLTATKMRHRVSTLYAGLDVPQSDRHVFYKHMGHSENINVNVYQVPLAVAEVRVVGPRLQQMDGQVPCSAIPAATSTDSTTTSQGDGNDGDIEMAVGLQAAVRNPAIAMNVGRRSEACGPMRAVALESESDLRTDGPLMAETRGMRNESRDMVEGAKKRKRTTQSVATSDSSSDSESPLMAETRGMRNESRDMVKGAKMKKRTTKPKSATWDRNPGTDNQPLQVVTTQAVSADKHSTSQISGDSESQYQPNPKGQY
jgi:hypothetical protein